MKKLIFLLLFAPCFLVAQITGRLGSNGLPESNPAYPISGPIQDPATQWVYAEIVGTTKPFSFGTKCTVEIDYGQKWSLVSDKRIRNEDGKVITFNSMVDAMNYMGEGGWEFVQAYTITSGNSNIYHWLMRADKSKMTFVPNTK
jgi:hypothetical protein